jgi:ribonuclease HI
VLIPGETRENNERQLHVFVDASQDVYSAVAYMRNAGENVVLKFVQAKSRFEPVKAAHTIPRMELLAAEMGLALTKKLVATLDIQHKDIHLWTDSRAVHDWLRVKTRALQVFVKNRVLKIRQYLKLEQVPWVPGLMNPADPATIGLSVIILKEAKNWLLGPEFLKQTENEWQIQPPETWQTSCQKQ